MLKLNLAYSTFLFFFCRLLLVPRLWWWTQISHLLLITGFQCTVMFCITLTSKTYFINWSILDTFYDSIQASRMEKLHTPCYHFCCHSSDAIFSYSISLISNLERAWVGSCLTCSWHLHVGKWSCVVVLSWQRHVQMFHFLVCILFIFLGLGKPLLTVPTKVQ